MELGSAASRTQHLPAVQSFGRRWGYWIFWLSWTAHRLRGEQEINHQQAKESGETGLMI
jgi:hypothetical protein